MQESLDEIESLRRLLMAEEQREAMLLNDLRQSDLELESVKESAALFKEIKKFQDTSRINASFILSENIPIPEDLRKLLVREESLTQQLEFYSQKKKDIKSIIVGNDEASDIVIERFIADVAKE